MSQNPYADPRDSASMRIPQVEVVDVDGDGDKADNELISAPEEKEELEAHGLQDSEEKEAQGGDDYPGLSFMDILRFILLAILTSSGLSYLVTQESFTWGVKPASIRAAVMKRFKSPVEMTPAQLALYNGTDLSLPIYLAVNGTIFDVSAGARMYAKGASYHHLAGIAADRAFVTGCFKEDRTSDLRGVEQMFIPIEDCEEDLSKPGCEGEAALTPAEKKVRREQELRRAKAHVQKAIAGWYSFYDKSDKYFKIGRVVSAQVDPGTPIPPLCEKAVMSRPKRSEMKKYEEQRKEKERHMAQITGSKKHKRG